MSANPEQPEKDERARLLEGGDRAFADLFQENRERIERVVQFRIDPRIRGRLDPADILQEAYLEAARRYPEYVASSEVSFFVWLRQKVMQTLIDLQRKQFREKRDANREVRYLAAADPDATSLSIAQFLFDQMASPSQILSHAEEVERLEAALRSMNETDREVLALRHFEHLSNLQVAEILELSPTAASNRYVRAVARLSEILNQHRSNRPRE